MHAGEGRGPGLTPRLVGQRGGTTKETLTEAQMPQHSHPFLGSSNASSASPSNSVGVGAARMYSAAGTAEAMADQKVDSTGGGAAHNNVQPTITCVWIIRG